LHKLSQREMVFSFC